MERCPTQAVLPLVGLAAEKVIRDRYELLPVKRQPAFVKQAAPVRVGMGLLKSPGTATDHLRPELIVRVGIEHGRVKPLFFDFARRAK
ncbi:MAG: hypothetical protein ACQESR_21655 [Planctomycetota bacterium]